MSELQSRTGFDEREREFVRSALRRYMQEHRIGTPALQYRIIEADQPRRREIPLSTLQRFVTGSHHTQDHHVALCHAFVRELPYYGEGRDVALLGAALFGFLQGQVQSSEREGLTERLAREVAGTYESAFEILTLTPLERQPFLHARETAAGHPVRDEATGLTSDELSARRRFREGVAILNAFYLYVILRDTLTRQLRLCCLMRPAARPKAEDTGKDTKVLQGHTFQPPFLDGMQTALKPVHFVEAAAREWA